MRWLGNRQGDGANFSRRSTPTGLTFGSFFMEQLKVSRLWSLTHFYQGLQTETQSWSLTTGALIGTSFWTKGRGLDGLGKEEGVGKRDTAFSGPEMGHSKKKVWFLRLYSSKVSLAPSAKGPS